MKFFVLYKSNQFMIFRPEILQCLSSISLVRRQCFSLMILLFFFLIFAQYIYISFLMTYQRLFSFIL